MSDDSLSVGCVALGSEEALAAIEVNSVNSSHARKGSSQPSLWLGRRNSQSSFHLGLSLLKPSLPEQLPSLQGAGVRAVLALKEIDTRAQNSGEIFPKVRFLFDSI